MPNLLLLAIPTVTGRYKGIKMKYLGQTSAEHFQDIDETGWTSIESFCLS